MAAIDVNAGSTVCRKCGIAYSRLKGYFPVSYSALYKGTGYLPYCRECVDGMYNTYLAECNSPKDAARQVCRKLDIYWNEGMFEHTEKTSASRSMMTAYIAKSNSTRTTGKSYDDTLRELGMLWVWPEQYADYKAAAKQNEEAAEESAIDEPQIEITDAIVAFWGPGNTSKLYADLEQRYQYWKENLPSGVDVEDIGVQALLRQICSIEIEINRDRAAGKSTDKLVNTLNTLLGSAMLKPAQKKDELDSSIEMLPLGVWTKRWEDKRPLPDIDPGLKDRDGIIHYVCVWFYGHLCKMLGIKNGYSKLYEEEIERLRVERPEFEDEDEDDLLYHVFSQAPDGDSDE